MQEPCASRASPSLLEGKVWLLHTFTDRQMQTLQSSTLHPPPCCKVYKHCTNEALIWIIMYDYVHTYLDNMLHDNRRSQEWMLGSGTFSTPKSLMKISSIKTWQAGGGESDACNLTVHIDEHQLITSFLQCSVSCNIHSFPWSGTLGMLYYGFGFNSWDHLLWFSHMVQLHLFISCILPTPCMSLMVFRQMSSQKRMPT